MKPRKPFMIQHTRIKDDCYAVVYKSLAYEHEYQHVDWVDWDGTRFKTRGEAEAAIRSCGYKSAEVIEVIDEIRTVIGR